MLAAFFKALFAGIAAIFRDWRFDRDYRESIIEKTRRDEEDRVRAGADATRKRMQDAKAKPDPAFDAIRKRLRARNPDTS